MEIESRVQTTGGGWGGGEGRRVVERGVRVEGCCGEACRGGRVRRGVRGEGVEGCRDVEVEGC